MTGHMNNLNTNDTAAAITRLARRMHILLVHQLLGNGQRLLEKYA